MHLVKTAELVRREMQQHSVNFQGRFDQRDIEDAVPQSLLEFVSMIESQCIYNVRSSHGSASNHLCNTMLIKKNQNTQRHQVPFVSYISKDKKASTH